MFTEQTMNDKKVSNPAEHYLLRYPHGCSDLAVTSSAATAFHNLNFVLPNLIVKLFQGSFFYISNIIMKKLPKGLVHM